MPSIMSGSELAPAWGQPDQIHLPAVARKVLLMLRGSRGSGEEGEMEGKHGHQHLCNEGSLGQCLLVGRKKGREDGVREEMEDFFQEQNL